MSFTPEFGYHTFRDIDDSRKQIDLIRKEEVEEDNELREKAGELILPLLSETGSIKYIELVDRIAKKLCFGGDEQAALNESNQIPLPIKEAVLDAWHLGVFDMASDRTVTLRPQGVRFTECIR